MHPLLRANLLLFPPSCRRCGQVMNPLAGLLAAPAGGFPHLCPECDAALPWAGAARGRDIPGLSRVWAACFYDAPVSDWIRALKYARRDPLAALMGSLLGRAQGDAELPAQADAVVPVPLHPRRLRRRGFNQSLLLAHRWRQWVRRGGGRPPALRPGLLIRERDTRPQVELDGPSRLRNVEGAFAVRPQAVGGAQALRGLRVILVDDVTTTGSTLADCARALREAGAARVDALVVARSRGEGEDAADSGGNSLAGAQKG